MGVLKPDVENKYWKNGKVVSGGDEVGMGAFAGPVVAAVVCFDGSRIKSGMTVRDDKIIINDSKKLTAKRRENAREWISETASYVGIGEGSVGEIDSFGIKGALSLAFARAIGAHRCDMFLVDGFEIPKIALTQKPIVKGDGKVFSIAAASIVAKVYRDSLMVKLAQEHGVYGWERNKGYGTAEHRESIVKHGTTKHHRQQYVRSYLSKIT